MLPCSIDSLKANVKFSPQKNSPLLKGTVKIPTGVRNRNGAASARFPLMCNKFFNKPKAAENRQ